MYTISGMIWKEITYKAKFKVDKSYHMELKSLLHFSMATHLSIPEFTNVLLTTILVREPEQFTITMETTILETTFVESAS